MSPTNPNYSQPLVSAAMLASSTSALSLGEPQPHNIVASSAFGKMPYVAPTNDRQQRNTVRSGGVHKRTSSAQQAAESSSRKSSSTPGNKHRRSRSKTKSDDEENAGSDGDGHDGSDDGADNGEGTSAEQLRRRRFLERNRIAASKCRQKKKIWIQELERRAEDVTMQNRSLHIAVAQLKEEVMILKNQLLAHRNCGCTAIQQYLHTEAAATGDSAAVAQAMSAAMAASSGFPLATQPPQTLGASQQQIAHSVTAQAVAAAAAAPSLLIPPPQQVTQAHHPQAQGLILPTPQQTQQHHQHSSSVDLSSISQTNPPVLTASPSGGATFITTSAALSKNANLGTGP
ncbi:hypothetical protein LPJ64_004605 [Coemansia asiatica]|uniref:BZIP domain-containing protein n=1 Tax=Coemansia asiatica TaxID=1052880 RepID=A0A9W8CH53_9FUNG|nr:hypothetical protein LPJ64_004605 [Coemansia asiatica]